jgi:hypothetical protein
MNACVSLWECTQTFNSITCIVDTTTSGRTLGRSALTRPTYVWASVQ